MLKMKYFWTDSKEEFLEHCKAQVASGDCDLSAMELGLLLEMIEEKALSEGAQHKGKKESGWYVEDAYSNYYGPFPTKEQASEFSDRPTKGTDETGLHGNTCANYQPEED